MFSTTRERALAMLIADGPVYRADLARSLAVSRTTVTNVTQELMNEGLLDVETGTALKAPLRITNRAGILISVVFRLRSTTVAMGSVDGSTTALRQGDQAPAERGGERLRTASLLIQELLAEAGQPQVLAGHVAVNTQIDNRTGEVMGGEASRMWSGVNPLTVMAKAMGAPVTVENTARLMALSEHLSYVGEKPRNLVYVHLSHGIAMGQVLHGSIVQGSHGGAGELGHMSIDRTGLPCECGNRGCLMQYVDEKVVLARARMILGTSATIEDFLTAASEGSRPCGNLLADVGASLGEALVNVCHLLDPDAVVLGGTLSRAGELIVAPIRRVIAQRALPLNARGLVVKTASTSMSRGTVAAAGLHSLRSDPARVQALVRDILAPLPVPIMPR